MKVTKDVWDKTFELESHRCCFEIFKTEMLDEPLYLKIAWQDEYYGDQSILLSYDIRDEVQRGLMPGKPNLPRCDFWSVQPHERYPDDFSWVVMQNKLLRPYVGKGWIQI